jgi:hypothetical protein
MIYSKYVNNEFAPGAFRDIVAAHFNQEKGKNGI